MATDTARLALAIQTLDAMETALNIISVGGIAQYRSSTDGGLVQDYLNWSPAVLQAAISAQEEKVARLDAKVNSTSHGRFLVKNMARY